MITPDFETFRRLTERGNRGNVVALRRRLMSDQLTPVLAYRRLVAPDDRTAPSFLFESVESGDRVGRHSMLGAQPAIEVIARGFDLAIHDHRDGSTRHVRTDDPLAALRALSADWRYVEDDRLRQVNVAGFVGGWIGYAAYDAVRYLEPEKLPFDRAPRDDRGIAELHFGLYRQTVMFDHVDKTLTVSAVVHLDEHPSIDAAYEHGWAELDQLIKRIETHAVPLPAGSLSIDTIAHPAVPPAANFTRPDFEAAVRRCREYIAAGDIFQVVLSQRFERHTTADPFEIYRALRIVNPSPYMIYLQAADCILVASSPEILCRTQGRQVVNRPLAGTRRRGRTFDEDTALERELRGSEKERAEHIMLVDLGRNDLGRVCNPGSIALQRMMDVERYSHVMHLSSTITGVLQDRLDCWDALRNTLPVGTVSGAPKIRAMQIIDELEPTRRGPYAGGIGAIGFNGDMDIALALRTMVIPTNRRNQDMWSVHLQAGAGIVADSDPHAEYEETVNKAAALGRAIDLAESAFVDL